MKKRRTLVDLEAPTSVFWDIDKCPVPSGFDARQVFPCIKRFLKNLGYSGPLTITAVGNLTHIPCYILRVLYSTGIYLAHTIPGYRDATRHLFHWSADIEPPINVMLISTLRRHYTGFSVLRSWGFNVIYGFPHSNFMVPGPLEEEDKCGDTIGWQCTVCHDRTGLGTGLGAERLIKHFSTPKHKQNLLELLPLLPPCGCVCSIHTPVEAPMVEKQPKAKTKNSGFHLRKTKVLWKYKKKLKYKLEEEE